MLSVIINVYMNEQIHDCATLGNFLNVSLFQFYKCIIHITLFWKISQVLIVLICLWDFISLSGILILSLVVFFFFYFPKVSGWPLWFPRGSEVSSVSVSITHVLGDPSTLSFFMFLSNCKSYQCIQTEDFLGRMEERELNQSVKVFALR